MKKYVLTIGFFDGVHIGHQKLIDTVIQQAKLNKLESILITFDRPASVITNKLADPAISLKDVIYKYPLITTLQEKIEILSTLGLNAIEVIEFTKEFSKISPEEFFYDILLKKFNLKKIVIGQGFRFGKDRTGDKKLLLKLCRENDIDFIEVPPVTYKNKIVSSTYIRKLILSGKISSANKFLVQPYSITGTVIKGRGIAKKFKLVPTANLQIDKNKLLPAGIFFTYVLLNEKVYKGVLFIGYNKTYSSLQTFSSVIASEAKQFLFNTSELFSVEVHIIDFDKNIAGEKIKLIPVKKLRDEKKFKTIPQLRNQILKDIQIVKTYFS